MGLLRTNVRCGIQKCPQPRPKLFPVTWLVSSLSGALAVWPVPSPTGFLGMCRLIPSSFSSGTRYPTGQGSDRLSRSAGCSQIKGPIRTALASMSERDRPIAELGRHKGPSSSREWHCILSCGEASAGRRDSLAAAVGPGCWTTGRHSSPALQQSLHAPCSSCTLLPILAGCLFYLSPRPSSQTTHISAN